MKEPFDVSSLRRFFGMINFVGKWILKLSERSYPLRKLLDKDCEWKWSDECQIAYEELKQCLIKAPILVFYDVTKEIKVSADASSKGLGAVLLQHEGGWKPVAFASRT